MGIGALIRLITIALILLVGGAGFWYISGLRADLAVSTENTKKLENAVKQQQEAIEQVKKDTEKIQAINKELNDKISNQNKDVDALKDRFTTNSKGEKRNFGKTAIENPSGMERAVNRGTANVLRCLEIASGAPLTETEKNATKPNEINKECPSIANPNYKSIGNN